MRRLLLSIIGVAMGPAMFGAPASGDIAPPAEEVLLMPLEEVRPGMEGEWRTVIAGTEIQDFPLEVLGVAENFIGPGRSLIICHATDEDNILSGPVSGMSGSPVFIDGKLVGAYAYGFTWAKEQAIIGVTPIEDMLEVFDRFGPGDEAATVAAGSRTFPQWVDEGDGDGRFVAAGGVGASLPPLGTLREYLQPLPTALSISGISPGVLSHFREHFQELGFEPALVPMGKASDDISADLRPGAAVAGVLLDGDFSMAGTGTVTYRDGDRILAFGHPFFGIGETAIPMAAAEIMTVVRSVVSSFKLSNTGPVIGSIYQDRLSAIAGEIGREAPTTALTVNVSGPNNHSVSYEGRLFRHPQLSPVVSAVALAESLTQTLEAAAEQTYFVTTRWEIEGFEPIQLHDTAAGPMAPMRIAMRQMQLLNQVLNNPFADPVVRSITHEVSFRDEWLISELAAVYLDRERVRAGDEIVLTAIMRNYRGERTTHRIPVALPRHLRAGEYSLFVGGGAAAGRRDPHLQGRPASLDQILDRAGRQRPRDSLYVLLLDDAPGVSVEGQTMANVLPSVRAALSSSNSRSQDRRVQNRILWESALDLEAEVSGQQVLRIEVE